MTADPVVYAVDDDPLTLRLMRALIGVAGLEIETFNSARMFLESFDPQRPACLVLDMNLPDMSGLEVQQRLSGDGIKLPIIFVTGHGDVDTCAQAFRDGAFDFLQKPVDDGVLVRQIRKALDTDIERRQKADGLMMGNGHCDLTARETDVLKLLVAGKTLKQIAAELQITIQTAAKHRTRVLEKHGVETDVELVRLLLDAPEPGTA